jgi:hypothetical protein
MIDETGREAIAFRRAQYRFIQLGSTAGENDLYGIEDLIARYVLMLRNGSEDRTQCTDAKWNVGRNC